MATPAPALAASAPQGRPPKQRNSPPPPKLPEPVQAQMVGTPTILVRSDGPFLVKAENSSVWGQPSLWISLGALCISILGFAATIFDKWWGIRKDQRARTQSIQDEFWLRKVLFPTALEPAINFMTATLSGLPPGSASEEVRIDYFLTFQTEHRLHARKLLLVGTMWSALYDRLNEKFEAIEDAVADFCGAPDEPGGGTTPNAHTNAMTAISQALNEFVVVIRDHQQTIV